MVTAAIVFTLGALWFAFEPAQPEVAASRRRAFIRRMQRQTAQQRERERVELGYRDHGGEG